MKFGYARISVYEQNLQKQIDQLIQWGCEKVYFDAQTHFHKHQPELDRCLNKLEENDTFVVCSLNNLGFNLKKFVKLMESFKNKKICFTSIDQNISSTDTKGIDFFSFITHLNALENSVFSEQTHSGLLKARTEGKKGGRPPHIESHKKETAYAMYINKSLPITQIAKTLGISRMTIYRYIDERQRLLRNL